MKQNKEVFNGYIPFSSRYGIVNDLLYKQGVLGVGWASANIRESEPVRMAQTPLCNIFPLEASSEYSDTLNKPEPEYRKPKGYDNPIADVTKLYEMILTLYDMGYKVRQYQSGNAKDDSGLEGRVDR